MITDKDTAYSLPWPLKTICLALVAGFAVLGLIGLVLPVVPGLLFLALAFWLLSKVSQRFASLLEDSPRLARRMGFLRRTRGLSVGQRLRLSLLVMAKMSLRGVESLVGLLRGNLSR